MLTEGPEIITSPKWDLMQLIFQVQHELLLAEYLDKLYWS